VSFEVTPCADVDEFIVALGAINQYGNWPLDREGAERFLRNHRLERMHAARENGQIVGGAGAFDFELTVPGGTVPTAGVTIVGVYPTHRRRGVLRTMMRAQLDDVRERGEPLAALWASEETIYGRFGYGLAALAGELNLPRERTAFARPLEGRGQARLLDAEEALERFPRVYDRVRKETPGMFARTRDWWDLRRIADPPEFRGGQGPKRYLAVDVDGETEGYALYRMQSSWEAGSPTGTVNVIEAMGATSHATAEVWRFLLDMDWTATINAGLLPVDHPLWFLLAEPRRMKFRVGDGLWVRLVEVGEALGARSYASDEPLVLDIADSFCAWNQGRWRLESGRAERTDAAADLRVDVVDLGSVYLGGFRWADLERAGRVEELADGAVARADRIFATSTPAPWCPEIF
jgi:predicted acetyltransferase